MDPTLSEASVVIAHPTDIARARRQVRALAQATGFDPIDCERLSLAIMELGSNLLRYAERGHLSVRRVDGEAVTGIEILSVDHGPGIVDIDQALQDGFSTGGGLGSGLPGVRRLMDTFEITSSPEGTMIRVTKWLMHR